MRKGFAVIGALALATTLASGLAGCGSQQQSTGGESAAPAGDGTSITVWADDKRAPELEALKADFTEKTKIDVQVIQKSESDMDKEFITQVPTGKGPDVIVLAHDRLGALVKNGVVGTYDLTDIAGEFAPAAIEGVTYNGQTYGVPYAVESVALVRNNKLTQATPATFDEMIAAGKEAGTEYPFIVQMGDKGDPYHFYAFQTSFGAPVFKQDASGSYSSELAMGGEQGTAFATWLGEQGAAKVFDPAITGDIAKQAFLDGKSPFIVTGPWNVPDFQAAGLDISALPIPAPGPEQAQPFVGVQAFFPSAKSENPVAVAKFLNWVSDADVQTKLCDTSKRLPARTAASAALDDAVLKGFADVASKGAPMPAIPEMGKVWDFWGVTEADIVSGRQQPAEGWNQMVTNVDDAIKQG